MPLMFALSARPHPPWLVYRAHQAQQQVFVGVHGRSHGSIAPWEQIFRPDSVVADLPRLIYITSPTAERELQCALHSRSVSPLP
jgi:hypothetical protein